MKQIGQPNMIRDASPRESCPNCGEPLSGRYCHRCGAKMVERDELTLRHFTKEVVGELFDIEHSKLFRTIRALLLKPGLLSAEYFAGRKDRYLTPFRLFLVFFTLSFFAYTVYKPISVYDFGHVLEMDTSGLLAPSVRRLAEQKRMDVETFVGRVNEKWQNYITLMPFLIAILFAMVLKVLYWTTGRHFVEHFVFALHFSSFALLLTLILWPVYFFIGLQMGAAYYVIFALTMFIWLAYLFRALQTFYLQRRGEALLMSFVLCALYYGINVAFVGVTFAIALSRIMFT